MSSLLRLVRSRSLARIRSIPAFVLPARKSWLIGLAWSSEEVAPAAELLSARVFSGAPHREHEPRPSGFSRPQLAQSIPRGPSFPQNRSLSTTTYTVFLQNHRLWAHSPARRSRAATVQLGLYPENSAEMRKSLSPEKKTDDGRREKKHAFLGASRPYPQNGGGGSKSSDPLARVHFAYRYRSAILRARVNKWISPCFCPFASSVQFSSRASG